MSLADNTLPDLEIEPSQQLLDQQLYLRSLNKQGSFLIVISETVQYDNELITAQIRYALLTKPQQFLRQENEETIKRPPKTLHNNMKRSFK